MNALGFKLAVRTIMNPARSTAEATDNHASSTGLSPVPGNYDRPQAGKPTILPSLPGATVTDTAVSHNL